MKRKEATVKWKEIKEEGVKLTTPRYDKYKHKLKDCERATIEHLLLTNDILTAIRKDIDNDEIAELHKRTKQMLYVALREYVLDKKQMENLRKEIEAKEEEPYERVFGW